MPTVDDPFITPKGNRVGVADDGGFAILGPLHVNSVIEAAGAA